MKYWLLPFYLLFGYSFTLAQSPKIDSLNRLISRASSDTARINLITKKISLVSEINIDSALALSLKTIESAHRVNYPSGEAFARVLAAQNYNYKGQYAASRTHLDVAQKIYKALNDPRKLIKVYNTYGTLYGMQSKYDSSIAFFEKSAALAKRHNDKVVLATIYTNIGISYQMLSNLPRALEYQQLSLTTAEANGDRTTQAYCLVNMANTYKLMADNKGAEQRYLQAIRLAKLEGIKNVELYAYTNLSAMYSQDSTSQKTYEFALKAARLAHQMGDPGIEATSLSRAASYLATVKRYKEAEAVNKQALSLADASGQPLNIHQTYSAMGTILKMQGKCASAIPFYEKSFAALKDADIYDEQTGVIYGELSACYEATGQYRQALSAYKTAAAISDSIRGKENVRKATELKMTYEFDKQQQIAQAQHQKQSELARTRQLALLAGMGLLLVVAAVSFYAYRTKQKANVSLEKQKQELEQTLTQLRLTQQQLIQSEKMASLGELTAGIAHEIQNPLNFVNNFSEVSTELIEELKEGPFQQVPDSEKEYAAEILGDLTQNLQKINHHGKRADSIVKGMLEHSRTSTGERKPTDLNALAEEYLKLAYHGLRAKDKSFNAQLVTDFDPNLKKTEVMAQDLGRVLLNLYNNAFYAVQEKQKTAPESYQPTVTVRTGQDQGQVRIQVQDNGTGMPENLKQKIFQPFFTTKPTGQGTGLGLSLSYDIITKGHSGRLDVETQPGEGTQMVVTLPA
ncbi:tetratricopeptide repeat protein [Larkinella insperata]|uniref:histidine kinase n=1 Tax=Larkinella insperata TaxID=332158 RepID=A0ABW3Q5J1_9BACT